nr:tetratricopeptide repeat protein [Gemmatimonadota bacterium]
MPGLGVLQEVPGELGGLLWQALRAVGLWAAVEPSERAGLFRPRAQEQRLADLLALSLEPALEEPLMALGRVLGPPDGVSAEHVGLACSRIATWAQGRGAQATQTEFSRAAALAHPGDARLALAAGRAIRDQGEYPRAETWYQRAVGLARHAGDWDAYARAYIGLGKVWIARGVYPAARKSLLKAHRAAERHSLHDAAGMALHDLFTVESDCHRDKEAQVYAEAALRTYGPGHRLLPTLAADVGYFWLVRGRFDDAFSVLKAAVPKMLPQQRMDGYSNLARAAAAAGEREVFSIASEFVCEAAAEAPGKAAALVEVARAAVTLGLFDQAEASAGQALAIARDRGESRVLLTAEGVLQSARNARSAMQRRPTSTAPMKAPVKAPPEAESVLACQF